MNSAQQKGFTLIELLVVILIIGALTGIVVSLLNPAEYLKQARDARRISNLLDIQTALSTGLTNISIELTTTASCTTCDSISGTFAVDGTGWVKFTNLSGRGLSDFIPILPRDPVNETGYVFSYYSDGASFELNTVLESEKYIEYMEQDGGNDNAVYERGFDLTLN